MKSVAELEVVPPEGLSAWDARAVQTGCRVAVPNTEGSGWVGKEEFSMRSCSLVRRWGGEESDKQSNLIIPIVMLIV